MKIMKKGLQWTVLLIMVCLAVACSDDDGIERPDWTKVTYNLDLGTGWLQLYDVTIEYLTADGQARTVTLTEDKWSEEDKVDGQYNRFKYRVTAKAKRTTFDTSDPAQKALLATDKDLTYTYEYYYYEKETSAHTFKPEEMGQVVKAGEIEKYVAEHPSITLVDHQITVGQKNE